ncbi:transcription elongation factor GreA [Pelolinea submarina]|jgi:transcription elongation factor GreA|uniref:Transcription elongation factor GreA n=1 Tax=Pelolinea submarina TaxID=913107 RepID=A0A347ZSQ7_9CHLR|nr:transcription elongation factor GreA [Pelolinea submarina]REG11089.1 transcription elongation factor GreA [Pelolinea submarina]BBB48338.1 transcription elongation factor GreA [Pelolinea submarina]
MANDIYLTPDGIEKVQAELEILINEKRPELSRRLRAAIEMGDLSENADYISAKEDQGFIEGRILELQHILKNAVAIEENENREYVQIGSEVVVKEEEYPEETFNIVGSKEANPDEGKISYESPIGKALLKHRVGDIVRVETPAGSINFKIVRIK